MPIVIKELFPSDPLSEAVEKINFNFDQLMLSGGGPPGPIGNPGPPGPIGPQGSRGDHWFIGASAFGQTADHDGGGPLQIQDHFLDPLGDVYYYFDDGMGSTGWTFSGINLAGPTGGIGGTGGSFEWTLYPGTGPQNAIGGTPAYGPINQPINVDDTNLNFLIPLGATKNGIIIGDPDWFYTKLIGWNNVPKNTGPGIEQSTPRFTVIQRTVDILGINGIQIGAYGLTGATSSNNDLIPAINLPIGATVDALDFFNLGIGVVYSYTKETQPRYYSHSGMIKTLQRDITIEAGNDFFVGSTAPNIRMRSNRFAIQSWDSSRWIASGPTASSNSPSSKSNIIAINSTVDTINTNTPYIQLQGSIGAAAGTVLIGPESSSANLIPFDNSYKNYSLTLSRNINSVATNQAQIIFVDPVGATASYDWNAKFVSYNETSTLPRGIVLSTPYFGVIGKADIINIFSKPVFPFHVNQNGTGIILPTTPWTGAAQPTNNYGWLAGFDKYDSTTGIKSRGVGINYITSNRYDSTNPFFGNTRNYREIAFNTYWLQSMPNSSSDPTIVTFNAFGIQTTIIRSTPHLSIQTSDEKLYGNLAIGFAPGGTTSSQLANQQIAYAPWSKLSVNGSIRVGSTNNGYHTVNRSNNWFPNGALVEGPILRGSTSLTDLTRTVGASGLTSGQVINMIEGSGDLGGTGIGISSIGWILGDNFLAKGGSSSTKTAYALADGKSGMRLGSTAGDAYLVASDDTTFSGINAADITSETLRFSTNGDFGLNRTGIQARGVYAESPRYLTTADLMYTIGFISGVAGQVTVSGNNKTWRYISHTIPTNRSIIFLDLSQQAAGNFRYVNNFNNQTIYDTSSPSYLSAPINAAISSSNNLTGWHGRRFVLEPGRYDGQHVTLIFGEVNTQNEFTIYRPGDLPSSSSAVTVTVPDRHILAANPVADRPFASDNFTAFPWRGQPYPIIGGSAATTAGPNMGFQETGRTNNWQAENIPLSNNSAYESYSAFVARSWRTITLRWLKVRSNYTGINNYAWVEVGREYLGRIDTGPNFNTQFSVGFPDGSGT
jgi:hypothetical protein